MGGQKRSGCLIVLEGIDGTGKSTQIALLAEVLRQDGLEVVVTREPTEGVYGQQIRRLYQNRESVSRHEELALFLADRREHVEKVIAPALEQGKVVISDRYYFSTAAYQGAVGFDPEDIIRQNELFAPVPDLVLLIELTPAQAVRRIEQYRQESLNHFEQEESLRQVAKVFASLHRDYLSRVDGSLDVGAVHAQIVAQVNSCLVAKQIRCSGNVSCQVKARWLCHDPIES
ncbi:MAG: dTMP kinase [Desulfobulbaceae bacterium]|nr:dTMP kinase [Desulfobulbaceae bacterium]